MPLSYCEVSRVMMRFLILAVGSPLSNPISMILSTYFSVLLEVPFEVG